MSAKGTHSAHLAWQTIGSASSASSTFSGEHYDGAAVIEHEGLWCFNDTDELVMCNFVLAPDVVRPFISRARRG